MDYTPTAAAMNTTGLMFKMYSDHFAVLSRLLFGQFAATCNRRTRLMRMSQRQPSGSPTYPLDMFAALTADRKYLTLAVVNATETEQKFDLNVTGARLAGPSTLWQMTGNSLDAANHVGNRRRSR